LGRKKVEDAKSEVMKVELTEVEEPKEKEEQGDPMQVDAKEEKKPVPKLSRQERRCGPLII